MEFTFVKRGRGQVLLYDGYQYSKKKQYINNSIWYKCSKCVSTKCLGSITIKDNQIIKRVEHASDCIPDEPKNIILEKIETCKNNVSCGDGRPLPEIYNDTILEFQQTGLDIVCHVPPFKQVKSGLYKKRNKSLGITKITHRKAVDVEVPTQFTNFLLADYNDDEIRVIIFCSQEVKTQIGQIGAFFGDGTFKICPSPFRQMYSIHGDIGSTNVNTEVVPLVYALMSHKTYKAYIILFEMIKSQLPSWNPKIFMTDFEDATMKAISTMFPDVVVKGCWFHFKTCLLRKAKSLDLHKERQTRRCISLCGSLALLPKETISDGWKYVKEEFSKFARIQPFLTYFENFWMKDNFLNVWCVANERHRTNNNIEGWHHKLNNSCRRNSTNIIQLCVILKKDADLNTMRLLQRATQIGQHSTSNRNKKVIEFDDLLIEYQMQLLTGEITIGHFLEKIR